MNKRDIILLRAIRYKIIELCNCIYEQKWRMVYKYWELLELELIKVSFEDLIWDEIIIQCKRCVETGNYLRLRDFLVYEMDLYIADQLFRLSEAIRMSLADEAKRENMDVLRKYHNDLLTRINNEYRKSRVESSYTGTDNVSISIKESGGTYRLYSSVNPWLESYNLIDGMEKHPYNEIYVLGFGGGYVIKELEKRFNGSPIYVYIPNLDIFRMVVNNISVASVLQYEKLRFVVDPTGLEFFIEINRKIRENICFTFYIDFQELRACTGSAYIAIDMIRETEKKTNTNNVLRNRIGEKIERYINGLNYDG